MKEMYESGKEMIYEMPGIPWQGEKGDLDTNSPFLCPSQDQEYTRLPYDYIGTNSLLRVVQWTILKHHSVTG